MFLNFFVIKVISLLQYFLYIINILYSNLLLLKTFLYLCDISSKILLESFF